VATESGEPRSRPTWLSLGSANSGLAMVSNSTATMAVDADPFLAVAESEELKRPR